MIPDLKCSALPSLLTTQLILTEKVKLILYTAFKYWKLARNSRLPGHGDRNRRWRKVKHMALLQESIRDEALVQPAFRVAGRGSLHNRTLEVEVAHGEQHSVGRAVTVVLGVYRTSALHRAVAAALPRA